MRRPVTVTLSVLTLLAMMLAPAGAAGSPGAGPVGRAGTLLEDLRRPHAFGARHDPAVRAEAMRTVLAERRDTGSPVPLLDDTLDAEHNTYPFPAGDLDGDGGVDVVVNAGAFPDGPEVLEARSGTDGQALWQVVSDEPVGRFGRPLGVDMTGDGNADVLDVVTLVHSREVTDTCYTGEVFNCTITDESAFTTVLTLRSGIDGTAAWTFVRDGWDRYEIGHTGTPADFEAWQALDAVSSQVTPHLSGDHDGDGVPDLVIDVQGVTWDDRVAGYDLTVAGDYAGHSRTRHDTEAVVVSGATGAETSVRVLADSLTAADVQPLDQTGDGLLWTSTTRPDYEYRCAFTPLDGGCEVTDGPETAQVEVLDGRTFAARWSMPVEPGEDARPLPADLTGDGVAEVALEGRLDVGGEVVDGVIVLDGATGAPLWGRHGTWTPQVVASLDGGPGADVLRVAATSQDGVPGRMVERIDGATGAQLLVSSHFAEPRGADEVLVVAGPIQDVTGDGVEDVAWRVHRLDRSRPCPEEGGGSSCDYFIVATTSEVWVADGRTGEAVLPVHHVDGYGMLHGVGDLDGDGAPDLLRLEAGDGPVAHTAVDVATGQDRWTVTHAETATLAGIGDMDGDGRADLLLDAVEEADGVRTSHLGSLSGADGAQRWWVTYGP